MAVTRAYDRFFPSLESHHTSDTSTLVMPNTRGRPSASPSVGKRTSPGASPSGTGKAKRPRTSADSPGAAGTIPALFSQSKVDVAADLARAAVEMEARSPAAASASADAASPPTATASPPTAAAPPPTKWSALSKEEETELRDFDLAMRFGPSVGPTRLQRWRRAEHWALGPPAQVLAILERLEADHPAHQCIFAK